MRYIAFAITILLSGCTNPYAEFYQGTPDARARLDYVPSTEPVTVYGSDDIQRDMRALLAKGYVPVGQASFNAASNSASKSQLLAQANKVGAHVVLVKSEFSHAISGAMPLTLPNTTTSYSSGTATAYGPGGPVTAYGSGTTTTYGSQTTMIPYTVQRYDFDALFLVKRISRVGIVAVGLTDEEHKMLGTNSGVRVDVVVENSGAFDAEILPGDIVLKFNEAKVRSVEHYQDLISSFRGASVTLSISRDGKEILKTVPVVQF